MKGSDRDIVVIGAGIVGVATALSLRRKGFGVTLIDAEGVAAGASFGNAGILATSEVIPVTTPGIAWQAPALLFDANQPLFMKWSYLPSMLPFLLRYLSHASHREMTRIATALAPLIQDSYDQHMALAAGSPAQSFIRPSDYIYLYDTRQDWLKEADQWKLKRELGFAYEEMGPADIAAESRHLGDRFGFAVRCTNHGQITDPGAYVCALADQFVREGGALRRARVTGFVVEDNTIRALKTPDGPLEADQVVLAAGAWSNDVLRMLGLKVPLESERGYHVEFLNPNIELRSTLMLRKYKFAVNAMAGRLRCGGIVEFGGLKAPPSRAPFDLLKRNARAAFPELQYDGIREWMGHRPSTSDSLPALGKTGQYANLWSAFGHQHLGLTAGPKTGQWLAQMIAGEPPNIDMSPYDANRFLR